MKTSATLRLFCFAIVFFLVRQSAFAQGAATGDLHVSVKDPKGSVVTNAIVTVRDVAKGLERTGSSDGQGGYSVRQLAPARIPSPWMHRASPKRKPPKSPSRSAG